MGLPQSRTSSARLSSLLEKPRKLERPVSATMTNRCRVEEIDGEEIFSFEFGPSEDGERLKQPPVGKNSVSLQRLLQSETHGSSGWRFAGDEMAMASDELEKKSSCSTCLPDEGMVEQFGMGDRTAKARVFRESGMKVRVCDCINKALFIVFLDFEARYCSG